jgi:phospholipase C
VPPFTREAFLRRSAAAGVGMLAGGWLFTTARAGTGARRRARRGDPPIRNLVISCQENRSFDHYFGFAPEVQRRGFGPPPGFSQPDAAGGTHPVFHQTALRGADPHHSWRASRLQYDGGRMDGFFESSSEAALGYYTADELPFYYSLFDAPDAALCANYFCSVIGSSAPNHLYMMSGTSGGVTANGPCCVGILDSAHWPTILDLLEEAGVTWKIYNVIGIDDILTSETDNSAVFWSRFASDPRTWASQADYLHDCVAGTLPAVSWLIPSARDRLDEHPPSDVSIGMRRQQQLIEAFRASPQYPRAAFLLTYDEHGGYFDHVPPPQVDAFGPGMRVPLWVISPMLRRRGVVTTRRPAEHVSTLKLIERLHDLPTLTSRNHTFDRSTPLGPGHDTHGAPAPPRDGLSAISDLTDLFDLDRGGGDETGAGVQSSPNRDESA